MNKRNERSAADLDITRFNRWAATYDRSLMQIAFFGPVHAKIISLLKQKGPQDPQCTIVDIGCGTCRLLRTVSANWPEAALFGVDPAEQMLLAAHRHNPNVTFILAPAESLPLPDQTAEMVLSSISFHHWADPQRGIQEVARILRPGGWFCLADHIFLPARLFGDNVKSRNQIRALMTGAGLSIRQHQSMGVRFVLITLAQKPVTRN